MKGGDDLEELNLRQKKFCEYYIGHNNATQAALQAGYSKRSAASIGNENLKKHEIQKYIKELNSDPQRFRILSALARQQILSDQILDEELEPALKQKAIDLLNKMTGEYIQKVDVSGGLGLQIGWQDDG